MTSVEVNLINLIIANDDHQEGIKLWLKASSHFHMARKLDSQATRKNFEELILVLYLSALEVGSTIDTDGPGMCKLCGQLKYSISKRVYDFVNTFSGKYIADKIKELYNARSRYLHVGHLLSSRNYIGTSIPQLDSNHPSGCKIQFPVQPIDLSEINSYCLRSLLKTFTYLHSPQR